MRHQRLQDTPGEVSLQEAASAPARELLRCLAIQVANGTTSPVAGDPDRERPEVMLEVEVAGARYLLLRSWPTAPPTPVVLSRREAEIARLVAKGHPNKTIAAALALSPWTVGTYIRRIFAKVGVNSRAAMVARLLEKGIIKEYQ